jgi:hypothetical protein
MSHKHTMSNQKLARERRKVERRERKQIKRLARRQAIIHMTEAQSP